MLENDQVPRRIRVKAMLVALDDAGAAQAVSVNPPTLENPEGFHRLIGGSVEFGETHREAIEREIDEELSARIDDLRLLGSVENIFEYNGGQGHEIVFIYSGRLDPQPAAEGATLTEGDMIVPVVWRPLDDADEALPLYPERAADLLRTVGVIAP